MHLTPAQIAVALICGERLPRTQHLSLSDRIREGHDFLVKLTRQDFGYDLQAWHDHLKESREGGYTYGRNIELPRIMRDALESPAWQAAVARLTDPQAGATRRTHDS